MDSRATERKILGFENKLLHPTAEPIPLPLDVLRSITSNFSDEQELGRGGYGVVYKGILPRGSVIAIKKFHERILVGDDRSFENEASSLMDIKHQNVVQLLGFCAESRGATMMKQPNGNGIFIHEQTRMLCFEYMCNGGLDKHLSDESSGLEWNTRYKIIKGICSGLKYLHGRNIIHLDLKPQNILLDTTMVPKIADFGLSRFLSEQKSKTVTSNCRGTTGYMAPEYIDRGVISEKADIFSLGVIIIEILKGCKDDYPDYGKEIEIDSQHFTEKVLSNWRNRFKRSSKYAPLELHTQLVKQCIDIALECVHPEKEKRPNVSNIIEILNAAEESFYGQNGEDLPVDHQSVKICRKDDPVPLMLRERGLHPDVVTCCIGSKEGYTDLIMELRRKLPSPQDPVVVDDILGENPGAYPVLRRQSAIESRWLWVELEAVVGQQTFTTTLAVRDDNVYCKGFRNQRGVWYELSGERTIQNCPMLPSSGDWGKVEQLPGWDVSYSSILQVHNREQIEYILSPGLGRAFAETAVRRLAQYPVVDGRDDYLTRISLAGLIVMVCESARFNVVLDTFLGGWDSGTGLTRRLAGYMWEWKDMSHGLLQWRMDGYWPRAHRTLVRSAGHALAHIHLVLNYNMNPKNAQGFYNLHVKNSRNNNPEQDKGGPDSGPASRGPLGSRQHTTNDNKSVLSKQASGSTKHGNSPDDRSEPGEGDRQRQRQLPGDDNAPDPGHPGDGEDDNAQQGPDQPGQDDSSQQGPDKISERYGRPRVEIFAVRANFLVTDMTISAFDGIRGQIIYMPKDQGEQQHETMEDEEMNNLVLTGPYRGISAYGNFAIQVDMPSSATGGSKEEANPSNSGGPVTWEWDRYNPEHAAQVDAPEPVTHAISLDSWRKISVTYLVMSNAVEATVKIKLPETPQDYLPHEKEQGDVDDDGGRKYTARGTMTAHIGGFDKHPIVLFTSAVDVPIPSESLTLPLARPTVQVPQGKRLRIDMADLHITEYSSKQEVKKPADTDSLSFHFGHVSSTPQFINDSEEVEVNVTWRPQQNKEKIQVKPHQVCLIGDKEEFSAFIGNLRLLLAGHPDREDALEDYRGKELTSTGEHPILTRPRAKQPKQWIHIEMQVVEGRETWSTTLAVQDDKYYGVGFMSQSGVWYDLGNRRGDRALPPEYNSVLLDWGVSYKDILHFSSWDEVVEELDSARPGKDFAQKAVRTLSRYPYVQEGDNTRLAVAGLFIMVCESAKFEPLCKHFVDGWDNWTGFPHQLMKYIRNWCHVSRGLLHWKDLGYDYDPWWHHLRQQPVGVISDPENALDVVHHAFNNREAPSNQVSVAAVSSYYIQKLYTLLRRGFDALVGSEPARQQEEPQLQQLLHQTPFHMFLREFSSDEIETMTQDFRSMVGQGGSTQVFRGNLDDGRPVAVKRIKIHTGYTVAGQDFQRELSIIASMHHRSLVRLLGYCLRRGGGDLFLVYPFFENGSLDMWLFTEERTCLMSWPKRFCIAVDVARALEYLHNACHLRILHLNIKPGNILLDSDFRAHVSDFDISLFIAQDATSVINTVRGNFGYMAPEMLINMVSDRCDVFSYGMTLLELISGRRNYQAMPWPNIVRNMQEKMAQGKHMELVDAAMTDVDEEEVETMARVALCCIQPERNMRPSMKNVVDMLEGRFSVNLPPKTRRTSPSVVNLSDPHSISENAVIDMHGA